MDLAALARAATASAHALTDAHARDPLGLMRWTPPQEEWLRLDAPRKLLRGGNQCLGGDSLVDTTTGPKRADAIAVGDAVWSYDNGARSVGVVTEVRVGGPQMLFRVDLSDGRTFTATGAHHVVTPSGPVRVVDLRKRQKVRAIGGGTVRVTRTYREGIGLYYGIAVGGLHNYSAAGVVHENCGKTVVGLAEVIFRATGRHPFRKIRPPPVEIWIVCTSWAQSVAIMQKFWALVPRNELRKGTTCDPRNGFGKDNPAVVFNNGSIVRFRTTNQGPEALAGATIDYVHIDEPCDEDVYRELDRRVMRRGGAIGITLTPINRPTGWLRELVTAGAVVEVHAKLTEANLTPRGARGPLRLLDGTPMNAAWIAEQWRLTPARYAGVVLDGEWETRPEGVFYSVFDPARHVSDRVRIDPRGGKIQWVLGFDYAAADRDYGHCASLSQVQRRVSDEGRVSWTVYTVDEVVLAGTDSTERAASEVVRMLGRQGLRWSDLDHVHGDNPVASRWVEKSNLQMMRALSKEMGVAYDRLMPRILNAKDNQRSAAAYDAGCRWIYARLAAGEMMVHPRCVRHIEGFQSWDYTRDHPHKDVLDAQRYALKTVIFTSTASTTARLLMR